MGLTWILSVNQTVSWLSKSSSHRNTGRCGLGLQKRGTGEEKMDDIHAPASFFRVGLPLRTTQTPGILLTFLLNLGLLLCLSTTAAVSQCIHDQASRQPIISPLPTKAPQVLASCNCLSSLWDITNFCRFLGDSGTESPPAVHTAFCSLPTFYFHMHIWGGWLTACTPHKTTRNLWAGHESLDWQLRAMGWPTLAAF